jgi:hypothetical protein
MAHFVTFSSDNAGLDKNSWGNEPVCKFYTDENSIYNFSFHETADKEALGNTIIIGGTGSGKTTFASFLLAQSMKYKKFKCMAFDRGLGLNIFANVIDANYTDFSNGIQNINPLQIDALRLLYLLFRETKNYKLNFHQCKTCKLVHCPSCFCLSLHCLMRKLQNVPYCRRSFDIL